MKKIYKIIVLHGAPKDSHTSIEEYIIAETDEEVFNYITNKYKNYDWEEEPFENEEFETYAKMKKDILINKGDLEHESGWEDAYYGVTKYGWEEIGKITDKEINTLKKLKILK